MGSEGAVSAETRASLNRKLEVTLSRQRRHARERPNDPAYPFRNGFARYQKGDANTLY